jgi:cbb3-type cytochrome oxidase maturation protein
MWTRYPKHRRKKVSGNIVILMLGVSTFLGALGLFALLWGVKTGQFDDQSKFIDGARYDNEEDLQDAKMMDEKRKEREAKRKREYRPE